MADDAGDGGKMPLAEFVGQYAQEKADTETSDMDEVEADMQTFRLLFPLAWKPNLTYLQKLLEKMFLNLVNKFFVILNFGVIVTVEARRSYGTNPNLDGKEAYFNEEDYYEE